MKNIRIYGVFILLVLICGTSCKKLIEVDSPDDWLDSEMVFSNDALARSAVIGLYSNIMGQTKYLLNGGMSLFGGLSADELRRTSIMNNDNEDQFTTNNLLSSNQLLFNNIWKPAYAYLYQCNIIVNRLEVSQGTSEEVRKRLMGEVKFVRALCYSYLVNLFGEIPLTTSADAGENAHLNKSSIPAVFALMKTDLLEDCFATVK